MKDEILNVQSVLSDLEKFTSKENAISSLTILNEIISSSQEETEFLCRSNGLDVIMSLLESDNKLSNICLKILANASVRDKKVRGKLLETNIFHLVAVKLQNETDFSMNNLIIYMSLIVALVQGNYEAQDQMRTSGCLSSIIYIMNSILDETEAEFLPPKTTELIIYSMIASCKEPRHEENQIEVGWIAPKILGYLGKQQISAASDQFQIIKCCWCFLKAVLDKNETNQQNFLDSFGLSIVFSSIQEILEANCSEMEDLLVKLTGVLVKLKSHQGFLCQASNYCPVMTLCSLLKSCNILVVQQTMIFLDSLSREFPQVLQLMKSDAISKQIKRTNQILLKSRTAAELGQKLYNRILFDIKKNSHFGSEISFCCSRESVHSNFREIASDLNFAKTHFCVVHDPDQTPRFQFDPEPFFNSTLQATERQKNENPNNIIFSPGNLNFHRKISKGKQKNLRKTIVRSIFSLRQQKKTRFNIGGIIQIFRKLYCFFFGIRNED